MSGNGPDPVLLGLFRTEAETGAGALVSGLADAETTPAFAERLPSLLRAAHSVKGAARIVGFDVAAKLAGGLEDTLMALERAGRGPSSARAMALREAAALIRGFGDASRPPDEVSAACAPRLGALLAALATEDGAPPRASFAPQPARLSARPPVDSALADLFRIEVEEGTSVLCSGLIALEQDPGSAEDWEAVLRAAHSIKGAARILGLAAFERLVHVLEDRLLAARDSSGGLASGGVDVMLEAVDAMKSTGRALDATGAGVDALEARCAALSVALAEGRSTAEPAREPRAAAAAPAPPAKPPERKRHISIVPPPAAEPAPGAAAHPRPPRSSVAPRANQRVLRVAAQSIDRLMGLAGESLVEARRIATLSKVLDRVRRRQGALLDALAALEAEQASGAPATAPRHVADVKARARDCMELVAQHAAELESYTRRAEELSERLYREALKSRMRPFSDGTQGFPRLVRDLARQLDKRVKFELAGGQTEVDRDVLESLEAPLNHLLRNALDHGIEDPDTRAAAGKSEDARLRLEARHHAGLLVITVSDDGRGIDVETIRTKAVKRKLIAPAMANNLSRAELLDFLFLPGFTTTEVVTEVSGRGIGLDVVKSTVEAAGGSVRVTSEPGAGTSFHLQLPVTRSVARALVATIAGESYAFPLLRIERVLRIPSDQVRTLEGSQYFVLDDANVALVGAAALLGMGGGAPEATELAVVVIGEKTQRFGLVVDGFAGEQDLVVRPLDPRLGKVQDVAAAALLADGSPALIVDVDDLLRSIDRAIRAGSLASVGKEPVAVMQRKRILVVDDSITVREAERQLLVNRGYDVDIAVDGIDALNSLRRSRYDLVVTDVDMPRLNGIELVRTLKQDSGLKAIPVVIVSYKDRGEDRLRGLDAGANYYLTKSSFHDEKLVEAVEDLIGAAA
jgi:two-component system, chemotaxis family, sensor histidine kinase and response regulator WspE